MGRKLRPEEVAGVIGNADILIARTEPITAELLALEEILRGNPKIALIKDNTPLVAAVIAPQTKESFYAEPGGGSFKNNNLLKCVAN